MESNYSPDIGKLIIKVYASLLLLFGLPGNIISAIIMGGDRSNRLTTRLIIIILAIADNLVLLTAVLRYWLMEVCGWDLRSTGPLTCKIHVFAVGFSTDFAVGVLCAVAVERLLVVTLPYKASKLVTLNSVIIGMICFALSVAIKNSPHFWMMGEHKSQQSQIDSINLYKINQTRTSGTINTHKMFIENSTKKESFKCTFVSEYEFIFRIFMKFDLISFAVLPYLILFTSNVIIYIKLRNQRRLMRCHANTTSMVSNTTNTNIISNSTHSSKLQRKLDRKSINQPESTNQLQHGDTRCKRSTRRPEGVIKLLTALTIIHVICTLPGTIFTFLSSYFNYFHNMPKHTHDQIKYGLVMLIFTNNAINFFGYCISCTTFRQTIIRSLNHLCHWKMNCHKRKQKNEIRDNNNNNNNGKYKPMDQKIISNVSLIKKQDQYT